MTVDATVAAVVSATLAFVISQTWKCLCVPATGKNSIFDKVFFDEEMLTEVASAAKLTFCPGLLDAVRSPTPPDISFFKKTPSKYLGLWGVYNLVLEKAGEIPLVYIGEASEKDQGIKARWRVYDNPQVPAYRKLLPSKVKDALDDGFKIVHKGVLAYCSIPGARNVPRFRLLYYSMEAMFSFLFWAMFPKTGDYQIGSCCPWPRESFTYGGLCSHSSLNDPMRANFKLSPDELELLAAQAEAQAAEKKRQRDYDRYHDNKAVNKASKTYYCEDCNLACPRRSNLEVHKTTPGHLKCVKLAAEGVVEKFRCEPCDEGFTSFEKLRAHQKTGAHLSVVIPPNEMPVAQNLHCDICGTTLLTAKKLEVHNKSSHHVLRLKKMAEGIDVNRWWCDVCNKGFEDERLLASHKKGATHKKNAEDAAGNDAPSILYSDADEDDLMDDVQDDAEDDTKSGRHCHVCNQPCATDWEFKRHNNSKKHLIRVAKIAAGVDFNKFRCDVCDKGFADVWALRTHDKGQRHKARLAALDAAD